MKAAGVSLDKISAKFSIHRDAVWRHWTRHVTAARKNTYLIGPAKFQELSDVAAEESGSVLDHLKVLRSILMAALSNSAKDGNYGELATLSQPLLKCLKQLGEVTGEIASIASTINITNSHTTILASPPFMDLQTGLLRVCMDHPEARAAIVMLLSELDQKYSEPAPLIDGRPAITCEAVEASA
jgi:hypothetical protein